jgi:LPS-assembly protein
MKNRKIFTFVLILLILKLLGFNTYAEEFKFEASQIETLDSGNIIKASKGTKIFGKNIIITSDKFQYDKKKSRAIIEGNVIIDDFNNKILINTEKVEYYKNIEKFISNEYTKVNFKNNFFLETKSIVYEKKINRLSSDEKTIISDIQKNTYQANSFVFLINEKTIRAKNLSFKDNGLNKIYIKDSIIDTDNKKIIGKDIYAEFDKSSLDNIENDPRFSGHSIAIINDTTTISKGIFTTCKKRGKDKCPPWSISAEEIKHNKKTKTINYKNAWLKVYDVPVAYFPRFFHPDPTVKRRSGFLIPKISTSTSFGNILELPYYHVLSNNKDLTFSPRVYSKKGYLLQTEFRNINKDSNHIFDFSFNSEEKNNATQNKRHFFSNSKFTQPMLDFNDSILEINIAKTSNDKYLKNHRIKSPLINNYTTLNSFAKFNGNKDDLAFSAAIESFEDLSKSKNDKNEFIYPNITLQKKINNNFFSNSFLTYDLNFYQNNYNTNSFDKVLINNLVYNPPKKKFKNGLRSEYNFILKNVNSDGTKSSRFKNTESYELLTDFQYKIDYPLKKIGESTDSFFNPILSAKFSPNQTKNIAGDDKRIDFNNIFSFNRIGRNDAVENGASLTIGSEYVKKDKQNNEIINFDIAHSMRTSVNNDLPTKSTIGKKNSDIVGNFAFKPYDIFHFDYDFSYEDDLNKANYESIKLTSKVNNFVTTFEFLNENNNLGNQSYLSNETSYNFGKNNILTYSVRKNKRTDLTEYYNLIYQYNNDCLKAGIEYNKQFYSHNDLGKPEERIYFTLTIIPFGKTKSPSLY